MLLLDALFSEWQWYRRWRGGRWIYASCPDGGWIRDEQRPSYPNPDIEDYTGLASPDQEP